MTNCFTHWYNALLWIYHLHVQEILTLSDYLAFSESLKSNKQYRREKAILEASQLIDKYPEEFINFYVLPRLKGSKYAPRL